MKAGRARKGMKREAEVRLGRDRKREEEIKMEEEKKMKL